MHAATETRTLRLLAVGLIGTLLLAACGRTSPTGASDPGTGSPEARPSASAGTDLSGIKTFLLGKVDELKASTESLRAASDRYYRLAKSSGFDYASLSKQKRAKTLRSIGDARTAWKSASPGYERIEGIVAGVPALAEYDVILDAGASGAEGGENVVPFDLKLPDGRVLPKPGNLFGVTESTLWGTDPNFVARGVRFDFDGDGKRELGDALPDANVLKAGADALDEYAGQLRESAREWAPTESDAFTALVVMVPTMSEYFDSWKNSRFVAGERSKQRDFVAISRLADIQDILSGLQVVYEGVSPRVRAQDPNQDRQIADGLEDLKGFVARVHANEQGGRRYTPEEADQLGAEAQDRATAITGRISQAAAELNVPIEQ
jgi:hypothetical protein